MKEHRVRYQEHKCNAKRRGIPWEITYPEWCMVWLESGRWSRRGCRKGQYCMARYGDAGAYSVGNVTIVLATTNLKNRVRPTVRKNKLTKYEADYL